jgi:arylsulfatase
MTERPLTLLVAASPDRETARTEFAALAEAIAAKQVASQGMILVSKDGDGAVTLDDTGNHLGRRGAGWGGGVGVLVGLFAPPMLASVAVGAARRGGGRASHKLTGGLQEGWGRRSSRAPPCSGIFAEESVLAASRRSARRSRVEMDTPA